MTNILTEIRCTLSCADGPYPADYPLGLATGATDNRRTTVNQPSKPFNIDKREVYEAYLQVRSNGGAAGVERSDD